MHSYDYLKSCNLLVLQLITITPTLAARNNHRVFYKMIARQGSSKNSMSQEMEFMG